MLAWKNALLRCPGGPACRAPVALVMDENDVCPRFDPMASAAVCLPVAARADGAAAAALDDAILDGAGGEAVTGLGAMRRVCTGTAPVTARLERTSIWSRPDQQRGGETE